MSGIKIEESWAFRATTRASAQGCGVKETRKIASDAAMELEGQIFRCLMGCGNATITIESGGLQSDRPVDITAALKFVRAEYQRHGISVREFGRMIGASPATVSRIFNEKRGTTPALIERMIAAVSAVNGWDVESWEVHRMTLRAYVTQERLK